MSRFFFQFGLLPICSILLLAGCGLQPRPAEVLGEDSDPGLRPLTVDEKAADFDQLLAIFKSYYGPYQYKEQLLGISIEKVAEDLKSKAVNAKTDEEFMGYVMQFGAQLKDGHVQFGIEYSASNVSRYRIPITLTSIQKKAIIGDIDKELATTFQMSVGDEILSIDGKTPYELMKTGLKYRRSARDLSDEAFFLTVALSRPSYMTELIPLKPTSEVKFQTASGEKRSVNLPWTMDKYNTQIDSVLRPGLHLSVPYVDEYNSIIDSHRGQMGQETPPFITPQTQATYKFVKVSPSDAAREKFGLKKEENPPIYAALYKYEGKTILLVRQATYSPSDFKGSIYMKAYMALFSEYESLADILVLDQTHNPGGSYCAQFYDLFANAGDVQSVQKLRTDRKWINDLYVLWPSENDPNGNPWETKLLQSWAAQVEKAYDQNFFLSEPIGIFTGSNYTTPQNYTWKKPMLVLIDELAGSCGDMFPMLVKANKRAKLFGQTTMGLGGNVEQVGQLNHSRIQIRLTRGMFSAYRADGAYVSADYIENNGVAPDIEYSHTVEDFRNGYVDYVKTFSNKALEQISPPSNPPVTRPAGH